MHNGFLELVEIRPRPGRGPLGFIMLLGCGACLAVALADIAPLWKMATLMAATGTACGGIRRRLLPGGRDYVARAFLLPDDRWTIFTAGAAPVTARLCSVWGAALGPVIALEWRCVDGRRRQAWLLERDLPRATWRRLRVRLSLS